MEDLQTIRGRILPNFKLADLKSLIKTINERVRPSPPLKISGNKKELNDRIDDLLLRYNQIGNQDSIRMLRQCIFYVQNGGQGSFSGSAPSMMSMQPRVAAPSTTTVTAPRPSSSSSSINPAMVSRPGSNIVTGHHYHHRSQQQQQQQHDLGPSLVPMGMLSSSSPSSSYGQSTRTFKPSPFYKEVETLCPPRLCTEAKERTMNVTLQFTTTPTLAARLKTDPELQIMIFCGWADTPPGQQILMEFPSVCEVKVNQRNLEANLRGMKNKPGTVAPGNITRLCRLESTGFNRIDFVYVNTTKKYNVSLHLVKRNSVDKIIRGIQQGKFLSKETMLQIIADRNRDADIVVSASTLTLKCPLGFMRINIPCRSSYCHHLQCFDGYTFFSLNEQTPTWTCPVCSRSMLSWEEIVVDGYFTDILQNTPASLESVTVQPDGQWEIPSSGKGGGASVTTTAAEPRKATPAPEPTVAKKKVPSDVFVLDDDDDEDDVEEVDGDGSGASKDRPSSSTPTTAAVVPSEPKQPVVEVIDLISDSEDEDGDTVMQSAAAAATNHAQDSHQASAGPSSAAAVKAEAVEPRAVAPPSSGLTAATPAATTSAAAAAGEGGSSIMGLATAGRTLGSTGNGMASAAAINTTTEPSSRGSSERSPQSTASSAATSESHSRAESAAANGWEAGDQEAFMHQLINPNRRKRQYEVDSEMQNLTAEARQRISRIELHSRASSERGGSSAVQSPDAAGRSTSSPSPATGGEELNSTRHVHHDRISNLIYDNLNAAAAAAAAAAATATSSSASSPGVAATASTPGFSTPSSSSSSSHSHSHLHAIHSSQGHYRSRPPPSSGPQQQQQQHQHQAPLPSSSYASASHSQSRSVPSSADYYSNYTRAPSTDHLRATATSSSSSSSSVAMPSSSSIASPPIHGSSTPSSSSGGANWSNSSGGWRGQGHGGSTSTWPSGESNLGRSTAASNGLYSTTPLTTSSSGGNTAAINPYAPRLSLEELGRAAGIIGYSNSASNSHGSSFYRTSSSNVTAHPQHGGSRHHSMGYGPNSSSTTGGGGRRGYDHRDASQTSPYAHRASSGTPGPGGIGGGGGGYTHGRSHSGGTHGYPGHDGPPQQENGGMVDSRPSSRRSSGGGGYGEDDGMGSSRGNGLHHSQQHHHNHHHHHHHHHPPPPPHHAAAPNNSSGLLRQPTEDLEEEEEEVVEQGYGRPIFFQGLRGARAR